jgi:hypothetical protein
VGNLASEPFNFSSFVHCTTLYKDIKVTIMCVLGSATERLVEHLVH